MSIFESKIISYSETKDFDERDISKLFLSVKWESGKYPEKIVKGLKNSSVVISAWDNEKLVGLVRALDDGETVAFLHYLLVNPAYQGQHIGSELIKRVLARYKDMLYVKIMPSDKAVIPFYEKLGFKIYDNYCAMEIKKV